MNKVFIGISTISSTIYIIFGVFGYLTFVHLPGELDKINILAAEPYADRYECQYSFLFYSLVVFMACPLVLKPIKDAVRHRLWKGNLSPRSNVCVTLLIVSICYVIALVVPIISDVIHIMGSTTSPFVSMCV